MNTFLMNQHPEEMEQCDPVRDDPTLRPYDPATGKCRLHDVPMNVGFDENGQPITVVCPECGIVESLPTIIKEID